MWKIAVLLILGLALHEAQAAKRVNAKTVVRRSLSKRSVEGKRELGELLELTKGEKLKEERSATTVKGTIKTRYQETYLEVPVYGTVVTVADDDPSDIEGEFFQAIDKDVSSVTPKVTKEEAMKAAIEMGGGEPANAYNKEIDLMIYVDGDDTAHLAYMTSFADSSTGEPTRPFNIIDANSKEVLSQWDGLDTGYTNMAGRGGNLKTGEYSYGSTTNYNHMRVTTNDGGTNCLMENEYVKVVHMNNGVTGAATHSVTCAQGAQDEVNGGYSAADDAMYFGTVIYKMFNEWYSIAPLSSKLIMRVHYSNNYENAFWDGTQMTFGDGASTFYPLVSLDVSAHEVCHGFTQQNSNLQYTGQSGGMNEAFSDMAGEAAKFYMKGTNDWKVGYDIFKSQNGALRYMDNPTSDGHSISHANQYTNGMDVHHSSGVYNKAFHNLATTANWGVRKAFDVMVKANRMYWSATSTFDQGACGVEDAAADLGYTVSDVTAAFSAVGVTCTRLPTLTTGTSVEVTAAQQAKVYYTYQNTGTSPVTFKTYGGTGDVDLYVKFGEQPSTNDYACRSWNYGNTETCTFNAPQQGKYYIMLHAYQAVTGARLKAEVGSSLSARALEVAVGKGSKRTGVKKVDLRSLLKHTKKVTL